MKKVIIVFLIGFVLFNRQINVEAKDTIFSINKYEEESLEYIKDAYNEEGKKDGFIVGGNYLKETLEQENNTYKDYQIILGKYNKDGKLLWKYSYGKTKEDIIDELVYTYNEIGNIDGYGIILEKTYDIVENVESKQMTFFKIDLNGKLVYEKDSSINKKERIKKLVPIFKDDKTLDYYYGIGTINDNSMKTIIVKYDRDFNLIWSKEIEDSQIAYTDIVPIYDNNHVNSFAVIGEKNENNKIGTSIIKLDQDGNNVSTIQSNLEQYDSYHLEIANNGFLLYGITSEVKLSKGEKSYFIIHYNLDGIEDWESIGELPIDSSKKIQLLPLKQEEEITKYYLEYINPIDSSMEVIELDNDGTFQKKIKKISADYYNIESFMIEENILYFVGQIKCPEDDDCEYDSNSLFLISDEDKVIEVKEEDSKNILYITIFILVVIVGIFIIRKKKSLNV